MIIRGIDLAARYSAFVDVGPGSSVFREGDSYGKRDIATTVLDHCDPGLIHLPGFFPEILLIEDLPAAIQFTGIVKSVCRIQGRIVGKMLPVGLERTFLVPPSTWQRSYKGVFKGGPQAARQVALDLGYSPPDMKVIHGDDFLSLKGPERQKVRSLLTKIETDYVDAFLIAQWGQTILQSGDLLDVPTLFRWDPEKQDFVSPSTAPKPRKRRPSAKATGD